MVRRAGHARRRGHESTRYTPRWALRRRDLGGDLGERYEVARQVQHITEVLVAAATGAAPGAGDWFTDSYAELLSALATAVATHRDPGRPPTSPTPCAAAGPAAANWPNAAPWPPTASAWTGARRRRCCWRWNAPATRCCRARGEPCSPVRPGIMHGTADDPREARMPDRPDVPAEILDRLRALCTALPDVYEEQAWAGTRWLVRRKTFAHVLGISDEYPPAHAREAPHVGDATVLTFRSSGDELAALAGTGHPFYKPGWHPQVVGMVVEPDADWTEIGELLTESYCLRAPRKLVALVRRPGPAAGGPG